MDGAKILGVLQVLLIVVGLVATAWGVYDMFFDSGGSTAVGVKKIMGGIAFAIITGLVLQWAIGKVEEVTPDDQKAQGAKAPIVFILPENEQLLNNGKYV